MKKLLLLSFLVSAFGAVQAQNFPKNGPENTWISKGNGKWEDASTWQAPIGWNGSCSTPGCTGTINGQPIDWTTINPTVIVARATKVEVWTEIKLRGFIKLEGATYSGSTEVTPGAQLSFIKDGSDKARLVLAYESFVLLEEGSDIASVTTNGTASDGNANHLDIYGPNPGTEPRRLTGKDINNVQAPALLWFGMAPDCGKEGGDCSIPGMLPVDLTRLNVRTLGSEVVVDWAVTKEWHFSHYEIEWSADAKSFTKAGTVWAKGTDGGAQQYSFRHQASQSGTLYYRLLSVDVDGTVDDKGIRMVRIGAESFRAYAKDGRLLINYNGPAESKVSVLDASGRLVSSTTLSADGIETLGFKSGVYLVQISNNLEKKTQRVIIN